MGSEWSGWEAAGREQSGETASRKRMAARVLVGFLPTNSRPPRAMKPREIDSGQKNKQKSLSGLSCTKFSTDRIEGESLGSRCHSSHACCSWTTDWMDALLKV
jgi:hypothetical protein